ncbi:FAD-dependent thiol oxidase [Thelephora ganbajun]|uniref:FAD-dependent thiol oxidase n=1 Tax=Thelephora ganbajun TaxID=370292 RepID=A0ACB6Z700_THEGA|nr:FAD-dependent thiol oxidase [Thelephora ganbajun]
MGNPTSSTPDTSKSEPLPPGMVIGPDGKPCKICTAFRHWKPPGTSKPKKAAAAGTVAATTVAAITNSDTDIRPAHCPPDVEILGRATWTFLHTTAAYYPENPTPAHRTSMLSLLKSLPLLYPCVHCAAHLGENMKENPPKVGNRFELSKWLCERHNDVNVRLGKEKFDCAKVDERWRDGPPDGSCD